MHQRLLHVLLNLLSLLNKEVTEVARVQVPVVVPVVVLVLAVVLVAHNKHLQAVND
jgi:hypothetical protein